MHEFSKWITTKPATTEEEGEQRRMCTLCGEGESETIPALGGVMDSADDSDTSEEQSAVESVEGDSSANGCAASVGSSIGGILLTMASCVFVDKMRKKKNK